MSGTKGTKPGKRKGWLNKHKIPVVYIGSTVPRKTVENIDVYARDNDTTISKMVKEWAVGKFGE